MKTYFENALNSSESKDITALTASYAFLLGRLEAFAQYVDGKEYDISRKEISMLLGFELTEKEKK